MTLPVHRLGATSIRVPAMGLGGTGLANMYQAISDGGASELVEGAVKRGVTLLDTAPCYGAGLSESRLGTVLPKLDRSSFTLSSKVGYELIPLANGEDLQSLFVDIPRFRTGYDFSYDGAMRSIEGSLRRLGVDRLDMVALHDPDEAVGADPATDPYAQSHFREAMDGAYRALDALRSQGVIGAVGVGMNQWQMLVDFAQAGDFDYFLVAGRYTLLQYDAAATLMPLCLERGITVIVGGPYCSGILASGAVEGAYFGYAPASAEMLAHVRRIEAVCARFGISLRAAALQFPLRHRAVVSVIPGARSLAELEENLDAMAEVVPDAFWRSLASEGLIDREILELQS